MNTELHHQATYNELNYFVHETVSWCGIFHHDSGLAFEFGTILDLGFLGSRCPESTFFSGLHWNFQKPQTLQ